MKKIVIALIIILLIALFVAFFACRNFIKISFGEKIMASEKPPYYICKCTGVILEAWNKRDIPKCIGIKYECKKVN